MKRGFKKDDIKTLGLSSLGGMLEFYDFIIFVFFASYFSKLFFPAHLDPFWQTLNTYGAFAAGYLARPLGGIVMAHFGDKYGRKNMFMLSILLMVVPTFSLGLMPTFESIGYAAPILLLLIRICQGIAIGGELPGAWVFVSEHAPKNHLFFSIGVLTSAVVGGILLGSLISLLINSIYTKEVIVEWAWRVPFIIGGVFGIISIYLRKFLSETPVFQEMQARNELEKMPLKSVFKSYKSSMLLSMLATWILTGCIVVMVLLMPNFMQGFLSKGGIEVGKISILYMQMFCIVSMCFGCVIYGILVDKFGLVSTSLFFGVFFILFVAMFFYGLFGGFKLEEIQILYYLAGFFASIGPCGAPFFMTMLFPSKIKFSGISFSYNIAYAASGGITPVLFVALSKENPELIGVYMVCLGVLFLVLSTLYNLKKDKNFE